MASKGKALSALAARIGGSILGGADPVITDVTHDSRSVGPGAMYVAIRGLRADGHRFVSAAIEAGAEAVCVDHATAATVPELVVDDTRAVLGALASAVHDDPSCSLDVIGVTGTNGKTTVTHYVESIAGDAGVVAGLVGTIHTRVGGVSLPATLTTPEASELQRLFAEMRDRGVSLVAVEVSSHALALGRVEGTRFAVAAFTNLSQDHLDFHGDMSAYRAAKERLFTQYDVGTAVINVDDPTGARLASSYQGQLVTVGRDGDVAASHIEPYPGGTRFRLDSEWGTTTVEAPVLGEFNVSNLLVAASCCLVVGIDFGEVVAGMSRVAGVPGRFEVVSGDDPITVIVDYAHTPEGVARAVETGRRLTGGRVIGLIGAGGDRDREKRPAMGSAISRADVAVITSDNPRSEDPADIVATVASGVDPRVEPVIEVDRRQAIAIAVEAAKDGDVVLILGRGHEPTQDLGSEMVPFDDREVAAEALTRRRKSPDYRGRSGSMSP
jgi:UDP-N-acetylmuramoyl-L-alanyl-D-glutamate--2,6-diaminopimelate ligase